MQKTHQLQDQWKHPHGRGEDNISLCVQTRLLETPPRAWGRLSKGTLLKTGRRNTPTGVGKTSRLSLLRLGGQKHPHGRGEDSNFFTNITSNVETPPRAWGRLQTVARQKLPGGNTPTGVGKTNFSFLPGTTWRKHPHGRGEDDRIAVKMKTMVETPPRAWGRLTGCAMPEASTRNTPTGVGKTIPPHLPTSCIRKHPHGRGEDRGCAGKTAATAETPPRAWGRQ